MQTKTKKNRSGTRRLSSVILEYLLLSALISLFSFLFLYTTSVSIGESYLLSRGISITDLQDMTFHIWLKSICITASILIFIVLFLFMLGQRLSYLLAIIRGIDALRTDWNEKDIPLEGNDDFTRLAESINFLSASQRELTRRENALKEEREAWIRSLMHDIRTPLTSLLSYTELMMNKSAPSENEIRTYASLVYSKADLINELTTRLMENRDGTWENVDNIGFLAEQLAEEWEEILEDRFQCASDLTECSSLSGAVDIFSLRRIMDNLASNIEKYADPHHPVNLVIKTDGQNLIFTQTNRKKMTESTTAESHRIGLESIRRICSLYDGSADVSEDEASFHICITLRIRPFLQNSSESPQKLL